MEVVLAFESEIRYSMEDGTIRDHMGRAIAAALHSKTFEVYLNITDLESAADVQVVVKWERSADGVNWAGVGTVLDTDEGGAGAAQKKVYDADSGTEHLGAHNRFIIGDQHLSGTPSTQVYAVASLHVVYKPF